MSRDAAIGLAQSAEGFDGMYDAGEYKKSVVPGQSEGRSLTDQDDDMPAFIARYEGGNYVEQRDRGEELYNEKVAMMDADGDGVVSLEERAAIDGKAKSCIWEKCVPPKPDHKDSVGGIMTGYKGHVPRARDKIGANPLGGLPGTPVSPNGFTTSNSAYGQTSGWKGTKTNDYATESADPQGLVSSPEKPKLPHSGHVRPGFGAPPPAQSYPARNRSHDARPRQSRSAHHTFSLACCPHVRRCVCYAALLLAAGHVPGGRDIIGRSTFQTEDSNNYLATKDMTVDQW